ncbi:Dr1-like protein [Drosera capensis]
MEPMDIVGKAKEDASLPKATMTKIIKEMLPPDVRVARDTQDLLIECCVEFINLVSSESNDVCNKEEKKTIAPEHVLKALESPSAYSMSKSTLSDDSDSVRTPVVGVSMSKSNQVLGFGEYIQDVCAAYEQHKQEVTDGVRGSGKWNNVAEMTEEEAVAEQQRMFAEARARMQGLSVQLRSPRAEAGPTQHATPPVLTEISEDEYCCLGPGAPAVAISVFWATPELAASSEFSFISDEGATYSTGKEAKVSSPFSELVFFCCSTDISFISDGGATDRFGKETGISSQALSELDLCCCSLDFSFISNEGATNSSGKEGEVSSPPLSE